MSEELKRRKIIEDRREEILKSTTSEQRLDEMKEFIRITGRKMYDID